MSNASPGGAYGGGVVASRRSENMNQSLDGLPLRLGAHGEPVRDLQQRLAAAGFDATTDAGTFGPDTDAAVRRFQQHRGIVADGICGRDTWSALIEAGYRLGDRLLYLRTPMLRGDDVGALQLRLGGLGFDAGRVDNIFGPDTERALKDFQRNTALTTDGVCGPDVLAAIERLGTMAQGPTSVAGVRERDRLERTPRRLGGRRIVVANLGGLDVLARSVAHSLQHAGASVVLVDHPDLSAQAQAANDFEAEVFLGVSLTPDAARRAAYYAVPGFESIGGRHLATLLEAGLTPALPTPVEAVGMRMTVLRETRMPAVVVHLGPADHVVRQQADLARALAASVAAWIAAPIAP